ncbi:FkbM family methyltransferase [Chitinophaga japonensis]|uniref:FkbM family methyltransferase n=1 Tax=Chitinophaga japonensis TaxID=104662 RepID=A0A562TD46_CHIJA|nr:FkbM family methyltransferase [Chitinophaga japonensis]TWI91481.1 FkbM family methyltransferase [Chitinophaga japonensis]
MVNSTLAKYANLIRNISNWHLYFSRKFNVPYNKLVFHIRNKGISFTTPAKSLYLVFKEIFLADVYNMDQLAAALPEHPVVIDIGGNAGYFSLFLLSRKKQARIYAYEAIAANCALFARHLDMNPPLKSMVQLHHKAVTGSPQATVTLHLETPEENSVTASVYNDFTKDNTYTAKVPCISLSEILFSNNLVKVDLVKVDCEGSEYPIIYETAPQLWEKIDRMAIEVHNLDGEKRNVASLGAYLTSVGFTWNNYELENGCYMLFAGKRA